MYSLKGKTVYAGIAIGKIEVHRKEKGSVRRYKVADRTEELVSCKIN